MLTLSQVKSKITAVTPVAEKHGKTNRPACTITVETTRSNLILIEFDPQLRNAFYQKGDEVAGQIDMLPDEDLGGLTALRFPWFTDTIKHPQMLQGWTVILHNGLEKSWIDLDECKIDNFSFQLKEGGSVIMRYRIFCHPSEREQGRIDHMLQNETDISVLPPETAETLFKEEAA